MKVKKSLNAKIIQAGALLYLGLMIISVFITWSTLKLVGFNTNKQELLQAVSTKQLTLESSVNKEITIALKMATSPLIEEYFANPDNTEIARYANKELLSYQNAFATKSSFWITDRNHVFYSNGQYSYVLDPEDPKEYWFKMTLDQKVPYNFNINYNEQLKAMNLWINATVRHNGQGIGIVGTGIDLTSFANTLFLEEDKFDLYIFNEKGEITGSKDRSIIQNKHQVYEYFNEPEVIKDIASKIGKNGTTFNVKYKNDSCVAAMIKIENISWYILAVQKPIIDIRNNPLLESIRWLLILALTSFAVIVIFVIRRIIKPIVCLNKEFLILGSGDLSSIDEFTNRNTKNLKRADEIGEMYKTLENVFHQFREVIYSVSNISHFIDSSSQQISDNAKLFLDTINEESKAMDCISSSIEEMTESIHDNAKSTKETEKLAEEAMKQTKQGEVSATNAINTISNIVTKIGIVKNIATRTNMLALNASIEANHAGVAGKGFAVVAAEIRKLSDSTTKAAAEITELSSSSVKVVKDTSEKINLAVPAIEKNANLIQEVSRISIEQETTVNSIEAEVSKVTQIATRANSACKELTDMAQELSDKSDSLIKKIEFFKL